MRRLIGILVLGLIGVLGAEEKTEGRVYEMRVYFANEGKLEGLKGRFRDHTCGLFEKYGMKNEAYFQPVDEKDERLIYLLSYPDRKAREAAWKGFLADEDWKKAYAASIEEGKLVKKIESTFLTVTDYSKGLKGSEKASGRLFELREYSTREGRLPNIHARFRDHTVALFEKHGIENLIYFDVMPEQKRTDDLLVYFVAHASEEARKASFAGFSKDEAWKKARAESVEDGPILVKKGVASTLLKAVDFSPVK